jgi:hypothetical protein
MGETDGFHGEKELGQGQESRADCVPGMCRAWGESSLPGKVWRRCEKRLAVSTDDALRKTLDKCFTPGW